MAPVQPNIERVKEEEGVGWRAGTPGAELSSNRRQSKVFEKTSQTDGGEKAEFRGLPADSEAGTKCPSAVDLVGFWKQAKKKKKVVSKEEAKPTSGLNPGQLRLQQNLLAVGNADSRA